MSRRDRVLDNSGVGEDGRVIFSDVSQVLLDHGRDLAAGAGVLDRCEFVLAPADDLAGVSDGSVDAVTTRSVLMAVKDKRRAFEEFYRVLKPGGRVSVFEPINRFRQPEPPHLFLGYDATAVQDLARKVTGVFRRIQPPETDPMLDFDERDLFDLTERAGFPEVHLAYAAELVADGACFENADWDTFLSAAGNPKIPTPREAMEKALTPGERERFSAHLRHLVENARRRKTSAVAYLWTTK